MKPIEPGNNRQGRSGKRRYRQCRTWKQKVCKQFPTFELRPTQKGEYDAIDLHYKMCFETGLVTHGG